MLLYVCLFITCMVMTAVITDITSFIIPNLLVIILLLTYPVMVVFASVMPDWKISLVIGLCTFFIGFILFALKIMGGGDVKFLSVMTIFVGKSGLLEFAMLVAVLGGALAIILLISRPALSYVYSKFGKSAGVVPRILTVGEAIPYGVAIGLSFLIMLWGGHIEGVAL